MPVKINVKVRQKACPFHRCKLLNLIFNFLEENLSRILYIMYLTVKILGKWPKINFFSSLSTLDKFFDDFNRNPRKNCFFFAKVTQWP
jgi:hypothetical protein